MKILLTGASGFVGQAILKSAQKNCIEIRPVFRRNNFYKACEDEVFVPEIDGKTDWSVALNGIDIVIHSAARSHIMNDKVNDNITEYRRINVLGTLNLARQAAASGVLRFIYISSIKVNGEFTMPGRRFTPEDTPAPSDAYGISKAEAEEGLKYISKETGMEVTIIRPPLVYGPNVKGNFATLTRWIQRGIPLPLGSVTKNRRSFVGLENLIDFIFVCTKHPKAANQIFLVSDGEDMSTRELIIKIANSMNCPIRLINIPVGLMIKFAKILKKDGFSERIFYSLQIDITKNNDLLDWSPMISVDDGLNRTWE